MTHTASHIIIDRMAANNEFLCASVYSMSPNQLQAALENLQTDIAALQKILEDDHKER